MGLNHTMLSRLAMVYEVVAVVTRQYALKNCLWQMSLGAKGKGPWGSGHSGFFIMTHIGSVTQNIRLVSSIL